MFQQLSGTKINHVPYQRGARGGNDLLTGIAAQ